MSEIQVTKATGYITVPAELVDQEHDFSSTLNRVLTAPADPNYVPPPPLPDPGPHPAYLALLDAAHAAGEVWVDLVVLHEPHGRAYPLTVSWHCEGEQPNGYEWEWPDWPCETVAILARHLGVEVPVA